MPRTPASTRRRGASGAAALLALATVWALREANLIRWGAAGVLEDRRAALQPMPQAAVAARLERVVDGDTIDVRIGATRERVWLIGIDTPERGQPGGAAATARLEELLVADAPYLMSDITDGTVTRACCVGRAGGWVAASRR